MWDPRGSQDLRFREGPGTVFSGYFRNLCMHSDIAYTDVPEVSTLITVWALMGAGPGDFVMRG